MLVARSDKNLEAIDKKIPTESQRLARIEVACATGHDRLHQPGRVAGQPLGVILRLAVAGDHGDPQRLASR